MSYYNKHERTALLGSINGEKKVLQALVTAELKTHPANSLLTQQTPRIHRSAPH